MQNFLTNLGLKIAEIATSKQFIAFYWNAGAMLCAVSVDALTNMLATFDLPNIATVIIGLVIARITKFLNTKKAENPLPTEN